MPALVPGSFVTGSVSKAISPNSYSCPFANYQFNFTTTALAPAGTSIIITFPAASGYSMSAINQCFNFIGLTSKIYFLVNLLGTSTITTSFTCTFTANSVTLTNYQTIAIGTSISFMVMGVQNPATSLAGNKKFIFDL